MYGMNPVGGYVTQYSQHLERDVNRGKSSVGDYYARKAEMLKILMTDTDSGESCTRGKKMNEQKLLGRRLENFLLGERGEGEVKGERVKDREPAHIERY